MNATLTPYQKKNLRKLSKGLKNRDFPGSFDMTYFLVGKWDVSVYPANLSDCNTVGCALGWGTLIVKDRMRRESYIKYASRVFGMRLGSSAYYWLFDQRWANIDNTPEGAAARIDWYLENGVPEWFFLCSFEQFYRSVVGQEVAYKRLNEYVTLLEDACKRDPNPGLHELITRIHRRTALNALTEELALYHMQRSDEHLHETLAKSVWS